MRACGSPAECVALFLEQGLLDLRVYMYRLAQGECCSFLAARNVLSLDLPAAHHPRRRLRQRRRLSTRRSTVYYMYSV